MRWARPYRSDAQQGPTPRKVTDVVQTGQQIWVRQVDNDWWLAQVPEVSSAVSLNPQTGAVLALVGGFDFNQVNLTARRKLCVRWGRTSNRSSTPPQWIKG